MFIDVTQGSSAKHPACFSVSGVASAMVKHECGAEHGRQGALLLFCSAHSYSNACISFGINKDELN